MARDAKQAGSSLKRRSPGGQARASRVNVETYEVNNVMGNATAIPVENNVQAAIAQIIPFRFESRDVRTLVIDGEPWFVAGDICKALGLTNASMAMQALDDDERSKLNLGRQGNSHIVNESGLFTLILRSREATTAGTPQHRFRKWVTAEVLPSIRKHGRYEGADNRMATLVGQTIGTDGFHMLGSLIKGKVSSLPAPVQRRAAAKIWSQTHAAFGVRTATDIPAEQLDAARNFIAAYALPGEWIPKELWRPKGECESPGHLLPPAQAKEILDRLTRLGQLFHPFSNQFGDVIGIGRALRGLHPRIGVHEPGYRQVIPRIG